jgi:hypothetical protein
MQSAPQDELKQRSYPKNQFDDEEYKRWSEKFRALKSAPSDWGIEAFLGQTEKP